MPGVELTEASSLYLLNVACLLNEGRKRNADNGSQAQN